MHDSTENTRRQRGADHSIPDFVTLADLASARVGGRVLEASDDFFAPKSNLLKPEAAVFIAGKYTARGKWMDGWESRRKRTPGHDWCVIRLGMRDVISGVDVDTSFFTGNFPSHCSIEASDGGEEWTTVLAQVALQGDAHNYFIVTDQRPWTHLRLNIFPDGGVARLRVYGEVIVDWKRAIGTGKAVDLAAIWNGGLVLGVSDMHYGARDNMLMPGRAKNMGDGWETRRRRGPGFDWAIVRLGATGTITRIEIDTKHFKGNYPDSASVEGCLAPGATLERLADATWFEVLPQTKLRADRRHLFSKTLQSRGQVSHIRLNIFPDGGVSRLRVHGIPSR
jgi:allantoicase